MRSRFDLSLKSPRIRIVGDLIKLFVQLVSTLSIFFHTVYIYPFNAFMKKLMNEENQSILNRKKQLIF